MELLHPREGACHAVHSAKRRHHRKPRDLFPPPPAALLANPPPQFDYRPGDVAYFPQSESHYVENVGDDDVVFLEVLQADRFADIALGQWLALTPPQVVKDTLHLSDDVVAKLNTEKQYIVPPMGYDEMGISVDGAAAGGEAGDSAATGAQAGAAGAGNASAPAAPAAAPAATAAPAAPASPVKQSGSIFNATLGSSTLSFPFRGSGMELD